MRMHLKRRAISAGYPGERIGFHSLRSGMLCSAIINAEDNEEARKAVFENTAIVAGWVPYGKPQMRYAKQPIVRGINATRLVGITRNPSKPTGSVLTSDLSRPEIFHSFDLAQPSVPVRTYPKVFKDRLTARLPLPDATPKQVSHYHTSCLNCVTYYFGKQFETQITMPESGKVKWDYVAAMVRNLGRDYIQSKLHEDVANVNTLVEDAMKILNEKNRKEIFKNRALALREEEPTEEIQREELREKKKRVRNEWTKKEDEELVAAVTAGKSFTEISKEEAWKKRDRKSIADHYSILQRRALAEHRQLPTPTSLNLPVRPCRVALTLSLDGKGEEKADKESENPEREESENLDRLEFTSRLIKRHCRGH